MIKQFTILFLWVIIEATAIAQKPYFKTYELPEPHKKTTIKKVHQSNDGYIWFGTDEGLFQFDGTQYTHFLRTDSLAQNQVSCFYNGEDGKLWIGYEDGGIAYLKDKHLILWQPSNNQINFPINGIVEGTGNSLWIATYGGGLFHYNSHQLTSINQSNGLSSNDIYAISLDKDGELWAGTDRGINVCHFKNEVPQIRNLAKKDGLPDEIVTDLLADEEGNIWIGTQDKGICYYQKKEKKIYSLTPDWSYGSINSLALFIDTELWISTQRNGVYRYSLANKTIKKVTGLNEELEKTRVFDLLKDKEGNIWVSANASKVYTTHRQFEFLPTTFQNIQSVLSDNDGKLWIGTASGLFSLEETASGRDTFHQHLKLEVKNVLSLYQDTYDNIWIGTFGDGVFCYHKATGLKKRLGEKEGLKNGSVFSIDGNEKKIYLATLNGVTSYNATYSIFDDSQIHFEHINQSRGLSTNYIYKVFVDSKNRIWFGTDGEGISVMKNGHIQNFPFVVTPASDTIPLKAVYSITEDKQGNIWFSTDNQGIIQYDGDHFHRLSLKEGIKSLSITSLASNQKGDILLVRPDGVDLLDPKSKHLIYYEEEVGIRELDPHLNATCIDSKGNIWVADQKGLIRFTTLKEKLEIHPTTILNQVSIDLQPIDFRLFNNFSHDQNNFAFNYSGLWYTNPEVVKYRYQLEGIDPGWVQSKDNQATYSGLHPGKYIFKVTSTENDAFEHEPIIEYAFEIQTPIWQRGWFIGLNILIFGTLLYAFIKLRDRRLQRINLLEREKIESQFQALKSQINPHFLFNTFNTLSIVIDEDPEMAIEYVEKLSDFYRTMMLYRNKEVIPLMEEIDLVKDYTYLLKKRFGDNLKVTINLNETDVYVAPLSLQILVENAIKHNIISKSEPLSIDIGKEKEAYIYVKNNIQPKLIAEASTGFGLQSLHKQYALLGGKKVKIENDGTFFKVSLPSIIKKPTQND